MHLKILLWARSPRTITLLLTLYGVVASLLIVHSLFSVWKLYQPLPLDDHWDFILDMSKWYGGTWQAADLWKQHNEHRILVPRLFFLTDVLFFNGNNVFLITLNVVIQLLHIWLLWYVIAQVDLPQPAHWAAVIASALFLLSAANLENLLWAFQTQFVLVFFSVSVACVALFKSSLPKLRWLVLTIVMGFISTFSLANGLLIWPILVGLAVIGGLGWRTTLVVAVAGLLVGGLCLLSFTPHPGHASPFESVQQPLAVLRYTALYLSGPFGQLLGRWLGIALGSLGLMLTISFAIEAIRLRGQLPTARFVLLGIAGFVVASALVTALGRINFPLEQALSDRYFTPVLIYWMATIVSCLAQRSPLLWWRRPLFGLGLGLLAAMSIGLAPLQFVEVRRWAVRTNKIKVGTVALLVNVQDDDAVRFLYPYPFVPWLGAEVLRTHALSVYGRPPAGLLGRSLADLAQVVPREQCAGAIDPDATLTVAADPRGGFRVSGWVNRKKTAFNPDAIALVSETDKIVGLGVMSLSTNPFALKVRRRIPTWTGYVADRFQARWVAAYILSLDTEMRACQLTAEAPVPRWAVR
jgi:hypothetical protein